MRLLKFSPADRPDGGCEICSEFAAPVPYPHKDAAGIAFHTKILKKHGFFVYPAEEEVAAKTPTEGMSRAQSTASLDTEPPAGVNWKGSKKKKKGKKEGLDMYALLGLQNERWMATEKQLKDAYRRVCLEHHPDKKLAGVTDEGEKTRAEDYFKQIQEAYNTLSDPVKRREYDSVDEFDDSLPLDCDRADFFKVFGPAFRRNARWSVDPAVPELGDDTSSWEDVDRFYNFWFTFKSWREFPHPDEEDVEGAESREHRRWIERNNSKLREKGKKDEGKRLREFVEAAYKVDPRVARKKQEERDERERKKAEKEAARRKAEEDAAAAKAAEEAAKAAAEEEAKRQAEEAKRQREAAKKAVKQQRQRLRAVCDGGAGDERLADEHDVDKLCTRLEADALAALGDALCVMGIGRDEQKAIVAKALQELADADAREAEVKAKAKREAEEALKSIAKRDHARKVAEMREWNDEELRMLDKAVAKFPQGTPKRWEAVAAYIRTRTLDEVVLMVKEKQGMSASRMRAQEDFRSGIKKKAEVQSAADLRINAFTDVDVSLAGEAAAKLMAAPGLAHSASASSIVSEASTSTRVSTGGASTTSKASTPSKASAAASKAPAAAAAPAAVDAGPKKIVSAESGAWTEEQELALVKALKQFGKELGTERWEKVSGVVPGKTKAQCFKRFKELREAFRAKKAAGGAVGDDDGDD